MATVTFEDERVKLSIKVRPASYLDDLNRLEMQEKAGNIKTDNVQTLVAAMFMYPRLICASPAGEIWIDGQAVAWPPTVESVMDLSSAAIEVWFAEVKRLNSSWFPDMAELEKKARETLQQTESSVSSKESLTKASQT